MSTTPVTVQVPDNPEAPVVAVMYEHALRVAYVERVSLRAVGKEWAEPGVYVLLSSDSSGKVYVGQSRDMRQRLRNHDAKPPLAWTRAVLVQRDTTYGFNTAEIGYLEGRVAAEIGALSSVTLVAGQKSGDGTLPSEMTLPLDAFVRSILAAVRMAGVSLVRAEDETEPDEAPGAKRATYPGEITDLVSAGLLRAGTELHIQQASVRKTGTVTTNGEILVAGVAYSKPSPAAKVALGQQSANGWTMWRVDNTDGPSLDDLRREWLAQRE